MSVYSHPPLRNRLIDLLPIQELELVKPVLEKVVMLKGHVIVRTDAPVDYIYFPHSGIGSVVAISPEGHKAEAGMFGREGFAPTSAAVGGTISIHEVLMQVAGEGVRLATRQLNALRPLCPILSNLLARFIHAFSSQISFTALSNAVHTIDERLARWLLMCHDRVDGNEISLTHEFISLMLAVRRPSVTTALHILEGQKLIRSERGRISIRDRSALEQFAGDAYGKPEQEYRRLIGDFPSLCPTGS